MAADFNCFCVILSMAAVIKSIGTPEKNFICQQGRRVNQSDFFFFCWNEEHSGKKKIS